MSNSLDRLPGLALFARIVQLGSLAKASRQLGVGRSSVSKQLAALESGLGVRLLQRSTRKITLTEAGKRLLPEAEKIADALLAIDGMAGELQGNITGKLRVSCSSGLGKIHLLPLLPAFYRRYPDVEVQLLLEDRFAKLIDEQIDIAIRVGHLPSSSLVARRLGEMTWILCASPDYLAQQGQPQTPSDLQYHRCLYYQNDTHAMNTWPFEKDGVETQVSVTGPLAINDAAALVTAAEQGMGVLLLDKNMVTESLAAGRLVSVLSEYRIRHGFPVYAVYPSRQQLAAKTRVFVDFLVDQLAPRLAAVVAEPAAK